MTSTILRKSSSRQAREESSVKIKWKVVVVVFGQATGAIHVSIVDLILPETPCFPFETFQVKRFLQTLRTNAFLGLSCDSDRMAFNA